MQIKIIVDLIMMAILLLLMPYELISEKAHELLGVCMLIVIIVHNLLNLQWYRSLWKGRYSATRWLCTIVNLLMFLAMAAMPISGVMIAKHIFPFLHLYSGTSTIRTVHLMLSHWVYVLTGVHLGFHWNMVIRRLGKWIDSAELVPWKLWLLRILETAITGYGAYAFVSRQFGSYMFLISRFAFFDYGEPLYSFYFDYFAIMALFVFFGHYTQKLFKYQAR